MKYNIVMHSANAIEARAKKAAQMKIEGNEYDPLIDPVAHHIFKNAFETEKLKMENNHMKTSKATTQRQRILKALKLSYNSR